MDLKFTTPPPVLARILARRASARQFIATAQLFIPDRKKQPETPSVGWSEIT